MRAYYNEHDPFAAAWLRQLIAGGHIAPGDVDERSIEDVYPSDIIGYTQCHFFAGIGVWSHALRRAGWPDDRPVWTGSCPCQPFSAAGKGAGVDDERHLWPAFHHLIAQCRPQVVFGEQVASKDGLSWLDLVHADMEGTGYAFGVADLCAAGFGAPHIRQRLFFVADANGTGQRARRKGQPAMGYGQAVESDCCAIWLADAEQHGDRCQAEPAGHGQPEAVGPADQRGGCGCSSGGLADNILQQRPDWKPGIGVDDAAPGRDEGAATVAGFRGDLRPGPTNGLWRDADWLHCRDGKFRPVEPGTFPLVDGTPNRVGRLRGYGNAIVAPVAEAFIRAYLGGE